MGYWEYLEDEDLSLEQLNALGRQGWELVSAYNESREVAGQPSLAWPQNTAIYVFKRPLHMATCVKCGKLFQFDPAKDFFDSSTGYYACGDCLSAPKPMEAPPPDEASNRALRKRGYGETGTPPLGPGPHPSAGENLGLINESATTKRGYGA